MNKTYFILLTTGMYFSIVECALAPDINLEGRLLTNNDIKILQLICTTDIPVQLCTVEFLKDKKTHDDIKYVNSNCYHSNGKCSSTICACSADCMSFTLNVTVPEDINNHLIYSCVSRMEKEGVTYLATISGIHDSNGGFKLYKKTVVSYGSLSSTQKTTTFSQDISTVSSISVPLVVVVASSVVTACAMLFSISLIICRRYCKSTPEKDRSANDYSQSHRQNDKNNCHGTPNHHILNKEDSSAPRSSRDMHLHVHSHEYLNTQEVKSSWKKFPSYQDLNNQSPHSSRGTLSHVHSQEYLKTQELRSSWKKCPSYQDLNNQSAHNSKNTSSLPRNQKYRHAPVPQKSNKAPTLIRTPEYRHPQDQNSTMNNLNFQVCYSAMPGYRRSTSTQSTSSGEGLSIYNIRLENTVLLPDLNESNV